MNLIKDSIAVLIIRIVGLIIQLAVFTLVARIHTLYEVGIFALINAIWGIARTLGPLGYDRAALRFIPGFLSQKRYDWAIEYIRIVTHHIKAYILLISITLFVIGCLVITWGSHYSNYGFSMIFLALGVPAYAYVGLDVCLLRSFGKSIQAQLPESAYLQILLISTIGATVLTGTSTIEYTLALQTISIWIIFGINRLLILRTIQGYPSHSDQKLTFDSVHAMALATLKGITATELAARIPVVLLAVVVSAELVGLFEGALRLGLLGTIPVWAVGVVVSPLFAKAVADANQTLLRQLYTIAGLIQLLPALLIFILLILFGSDLLTGLFGDSFQTVYGTTLIVAMAVVINAAGSIASNYLLMTGGEVEVLRYSTWSLIIVVIGIPVGSMLYGLEGGAYALVARSLVRDIGLMEFVSRTKGLRSGIFSIREIKWIYNEIISRSYFTTIERK